MKIGARGPDSSPQFSPEEPVEETYDENDKEADRKERGPIEGLVPLGHLLEIAKGDQELVLVHIEGEIGLAHDHEIDGPKAQLGQDTGQDRGDAKEDMENPRGQAGQHAGPQGQEHGQGQGFALEQHDHEDGPSCTKGAVHGQVCDIKGFVGQVDADGHDAPDQALGHGARQLVQKIWNT